MKKYSYYTPIELAECILKLLPSTEVNTVIDICCGSWNLLKAAKQKYSEAFIIGVDIDSDSREHKIEGAEFFAEDGRDFALDKKKAGQTYDLILSNPPFGYLHEESRKYNDKDFVEEECYSGLINKRYEGEMTQANMFLAHDGSILLFILPNTFVEGESLQKARRQIANDYSICDVIRLPPNTFEKGEINTFAIIMKKGISLETFTNLYDAKKDNDWRIVKIGEIRYSDIVRGNWWLQIEPLKNERTISLRRGNLSSSDFVKKGEMVFHNASKVGTTWKPSVRYYDKKTVGSKVVKAQRGDILVNRIGKGVGYWCQNTVSDVAVSDCIIVVENKVDGLVERFIKNSAADGRLKIPIRGVATPYLTAQDIKRMLADNV
jgi:type I restriction enzyme M protein